MRLNYNAKENHKHKKGLLNSIHCKVYQNNLHSDPFFFVTAYLDPMPECDQANFGNRDPANDDSENKS